MFFLSLVQLAHWLQCTLAASQHSQIPDRSFRCAQRNLITAGTVPPATSMLWVSSVRVFSSKLMIARAARVSNLEGCLFSLDTQSTHQTASYMSISASQRQYILFYEIMCAKCHVTSLSLRDPYRGPLPDSRWSLAIILVGIPFDFVMIWQDA